MISGEHRNLAIQFTFMVNTSLILTFSLMEEPAPPHESHKIVENTSETRM